MVRKFISMSFLLCVIFYCSTAFGLGSGGFRNEVVDAEASGKGYCFTAQADGPSAVHYNPAGLIQLKGSYVSLGYTFEAPRFESDSTGTGNTVQMQKQVFFVPNMYYVSDFSSEKWRFGFSVTAPYGLSTDWASDSFARYVSEESNVVMSNFNPTIAYKFSDKFYVAAGLDYFRGEVDKHKILAPTTSNGGDFQLKGSDESWGYNIGVLYNSSDKHRIGISYRSEINLTYKGIACLDNLNPTYTAAMGASTYTTAMESKGTIPRTIAAGYAYKVNDKLVIETDVEWTDWASVEEEMVLYPNEYNTTKLAVLNSGNPAARDWRDVFSYGVGAEYKVSDKLCLRTGAFYHESPIPSANFEPVLPDSDKYGLTFGVGYLLKNIKIDASYGYIKYLDREVTNDVGVATSGSNVDGKYRGYVNLCAVSFTYKY